MHSGMLLSRGIQRERLISLSCLGFISAPFYHVVRILLQGSFVFIVLVMLNDKFFMEFIC